jgi:hypothetical protein
MLLVLCDRSDDAALWAYERLVDRGIWPVECVTAECLPYARWVHRVGRNKASVDVVLPDGRSIRSEEVYGTLNRLLFVPQNGLALIRPSDREYVGQELAAFFSSWLHCLPGPMLNRGTTHCFSGRIRHVSEWVALAGRCSLPVNEYRYGGTPDPNGYSLHAKLPDAGVPARSVTVVDDTVLGEGVPDDIAAGCRRLAAASRLRILGADFAVNALGQWILAGVSSSPDLRLGGEPLIDCLAEAFEERSMAA